MDTTGQTIYEELEAELDKARARKANVMVVSVPGLGASHLVRLYAQNRMAEGVRYIRDGGGELGEFSLLDFGLDLDEGGVEKVDEYFKKAQIDQKMAVVVTAPYLLESDLLKNSYMYSHIYSTIYLRVLNEEETERLSRDLGGGEIEGLFELSGGISQLIKYLAIHEGKLEEDLERIVGPTVSVLMKTKPEILERMGLTKDGKVVSRIVREAIEKKGDEEGLDIDIDFDLTFKEDGEKSGEVLTETEKRILVRIMDNGGKISREEVSDIKWGEGKYDEFSDQAINKSMRRLGEKLIKYQIITVPKVGYVIKKNGSQ